MYVLPVRSCVPMSRPRTACLGDDEDMKAFMHALEHGQLPLPTMSIPQLFTALDSYVDYDVVL